MLYSHKLIKFSHKHQSAQTPMKQLFSALCLTTGLVIGLGAQAQGLSSSPGLTSKLTASRVELVDGKTVLLPAVNAKPDDVVEYSASYTNSGTKPIERIQAVVPVPVGTILVANSAKPASAQASLDGVNFFVMPLKRIVKLANGTSGEELVPLADYRALRWQVGTLGAGQEAVVSLRTRLVPTTGAEAAKR